MDGCLAVSSAYPAEEASTGALACTKLDSRQISADNNQRSSQQQEQGQHKRRQRAGNAAIKKQ